MRNLIKLVVAFLVAASAQSAFAASPQTDPFIVSATVPDSCVITGLVGDLAFGVYDSAANLDGSTSFTFRCTVNTTYDYYIARSATPRQMLNGADILQYDLYSDAPGGTLFPSLGAGQASTYLAVGPTTVDIFGRVPLGQFPPTGPYAETVTLTIDF